MKSIDRDNCVIKISDSGDTKTERKVEFWIWIERVWQWLIQGSIASNGIRIWTVKGIDGEEQWKAYDPRTGQTTSAMSEYELRTWMEHCYKF